MDTVAMRDSILSSHFQNLYVSHVSMAAMPAPMSRGVGHATNVSSIIETHPPMLNMNMHRSNAPRSMRHTFTPIPVRLASGTGGGSGYLI